MTFNFKHIHDATANHKISRRIVCEMSAKEIKTITLGTKQTNKIADALSKMTIQ